VLRAADFVPAGQRIDEDKLLRWFRKLNEPILEDREWTYTGEFAREVLRTTSDPREGYFDLLRRLNLPPDYLLLNRIQVGVNSILGQLAATANWFRIAQELSSDAAPATDLGRQEAAFMAASPFRA